MVSRSHEVDGTDVIVRPATSDDEAAIAALIGRSIEFQEPKPEDDDPMPAPGKGRFWVAESGADGVIGAVGCRIKDPSVGELHDLIVRDEHRGKGIGGALVRVALGFCRDHAVIKTVLEAADDQKAAINLFQKLGFRLHRERQRSGRASLEFYVDLYHDDGGPS